MYFSSGIRGWSPEGCLSQDLEQSLKGSYTLVYLHLTPAPGLIVTPLLSRLTEVTDTGEVSELGMERQQGSGGERLTALQQALKGVSDRQTVISVYSSARTIPCHPNTENKMYGISDKQII